MKNLHTRKTSKGSNFCWLIRQMSINQTVGGRRFVEGLYQALFSFRLARRNVLTKRNENWAWFLVTCPHADTTRPRYFETANSPLIFFLSCFILKEWCFSAWTKGMNTRIFLLGNAWRVTCLQWRKYCSSRMIIKLKAYCRFLMAILWSHSKLGNYNGEKKVENIAGNIVECEVKCSFVLRRFAKATPT